MPNRGGTKRRKNKRRNRRFFRKEPAERVARCDMVPNMKGFAVDLICGTNFGKRGRYGVWIETYIAKFKEGEIEFSEWYDNQRREFMRGKLDWPIPYPHEIFEDLMK